MKWAIYNVLFLFVYPLLLPGFLVRMLRRGGYAARMCDRIALYPEAVRREFASVRGAEGFVWVHAVSVGEVQVAGRLMKEWREAEPGVRFCFSTTSSTGWRTAEKVVSDRDVLIYNPLDFPTFVKAALLTVRPRAIVMTESEIWPNFIRRAAKMRIPLFLVNARVSDRSAPRYRAARIFFGDVFRCFARIFAQSDLDAERIRATYPRGASGGDASDNISVTGSFKFDAAARNEAKERELREWITGGGAPSSAGRILLGGSTWPGEDEVLLDIYREIASSGGDALLVIAPRHFEKADAVEANVRAAGFRCVRRSRGDRGGDARGAVFLADTTGELMGLYGIADAVFVGKSLCARGSQNMIEPCLCGKPTFVGPHTENFRPVMSDLLSARAIVQVEDAAELKARLVAIFRGGSAAQDAKALGERARKAVERRRGVVARCVAEARSLVQAAQGQRIAAGPPPQGGGSHE